MRLFQLSLALCLALGGAAVARAHSDVVPYALGGKIVTGGHDDVLGTDVITERVFGYDFGEDPLDPNFIGDPGFNNGSFAIGVYPNNGLLPANFTLGLNVLTNLSYWDGTGSVSFSAAPVSVDLGINRGSNTVHISGVGLTGTVPTIGSTGPSGRLHVHAQSTLNYTDGSNASAPNAPDGLYLVVLQLTLPGSGTANSDPIYFVYNNNLSETQHDEGIEWVQTNLVPEPSTWLLMAVSLGAIAATGRRKAKRLISQN